MHPRFTAHRTAVLRASALDPRDLPPWPTGPAADPDHLQAWIAWLRKVCAHPVLGPAIRQASPDLARQLDQVCRASTSGRDLVRVARSCARYVLRARSRATPLGLFAGVTTATFATAVSGRIGGEHQPVTRVSSSFIAMAVALLEACEAEFTARLMVTVNNLAVIRDGRIIVEHQPAPGAEWGTRSSLQLTAPACVALDAARTPIPWGEVEAVLNTAFPDRCDAVRALVEMLVHHRVLLSSLHPPLDVPDPLAHLIAAARSADAARYPHATEILTHLEDARQAVRDHDTAPTLAVRSRALDRTKAALDAVVPVDAPVSVDLRLDSDLELPRSVAWQAQEVAAVLARLSPDREGAPVWRDYHRRFCERYGPGAVVTVGEVTDPDRGLGFPAGFHGSRLTPPPAEALSERDAVLLDLAQRATVSGGEIVLDEAVLERLGATVPERVWPHTEVRVRIHAPNRQALDAGDFDLLVAGAARAAGTTTGRFLYLLSTADREALCDLYRCLPTLRQGALLAQLTCPSASARGDQVSRTFPVLDTRLALGQNHPPTRHMLTVDDLAVTADAHRLHLVTASGLRPVEPVVFSAIELTRAADPMMRFLAELPRARAAVPVPFDWGAAAHLPYLPRVRWHRCILAPARWRLDAHALPDLRGPWQEWVGSLHRWRAAHRVPARVELAEHDRHLGLDLEVPAHVDLLRARLERHGQVLLREAPADQDLAWIGGRAHEVVVTLTADQKPTQVRPRLGSAHPRAAEHLPGSTAGWCSVKLYGHPDHTIGLITGELPRLTTTGTSLTWWFLRYRDPDPHLRLRVRVEGPDQLTAVHAWTRDLSDRGLVAAVVHDTYIPESGRFGPGAAMEAAEALFVADSRAVAIQLAADPTDSGRRVWAAVSMTDFVHHLLEDAPAARRWLIDHAPPASTDRAEAAQTITLTDPGHESLPAPIQDAWSHRAEAARAYAKALTGFGSSAAEVLPDLLHLHSARLFGPDPDAERACLALARAAALSWNARIKEAR